MNKQEIIQELIAIYCMGTTVYGFDEKQLKAVKGAIDLIKAYESEMLQDPKEVTK